MDGSIVSQKKFNNSSETKKPAYLPVVSVIVATHYRDSSLRKALLSLVSQTYKCIEIIVVDDNAEDERSKRVEFIIQDIEQCSNCRILYIRNETNKGSAETRNIGIRAASGEYITFLDDDDIYLPNKVESQVKHMIEEDSDYCITDLELYDEKDRLIEKRHRKYVKQYNQDDLLRYHLMHHMTGTDTIMFKRDFLLSIGGFPPINVGDEFYLMQKAIEAGGIFSYLPICDIKAYVHTETDGLSSGESKIKGENDLYEFKKKYLGRLCVQDQKYIVMRHYAVLAFAEMRRKSYGNFMKYAMKSFFSSPINCARLFIEKSKEANLT